MIGFPIDFGKIGGEKWAVTEADASGTTAQRTRLVHIGRLMCGAGNVAASWCPEMPFVGNGHEMAK
jgi:hypothetical protein